MDLKLLPRATRANFLPASIIPFLIGTAFVCSQGVDVSIARFRFGFVGVICAHLAGNLLNDYFDHKTGADNIAIRRSPFFGGSRVIQQGLVKPKEVLRLSFIFFTVSALCGFSIFLISKNPVFLLLMLIAGLLTIEYTAPPLRFAYRRLGELDIFILFGVLMIMGSVYLFSENFTPGAFLISLPIAFLILGVLICNEIPDLPTDAATGKRNLVSLSGQRHGYLLYAGVIVLSALSIVANVYYGNLPVFALAALFVYFSGFKAAVILKLRFNDLKSCIYASKLTMNLHGMVGLLIIVMLLAKRFFS
ncbi:MAG: prenyltransferase [Candidatus Omnitrophota bacterium]|jgi:1,4-dihydroxy-2-naphthoate octaprenyltransferase